jgi:ketosteroid isomerase-like protein
MSSTLRSSLPILPLLALLGCAAPGPSALSDADVAANRALSQSFVDRMLAKDIDGASKLYADSALLLPPNSPPIRGRAAISAFMAGFPPITEFTTSDEVITGQGDLAYVTGRYRLVLGVPGAPVDSGKFLDVRRRQKDGSWLYVADMFSSNAPAPAAP